MCIRDRLNTEPGENRVTYNNLPPGKYTFQVRALNYGNYSETRTVKLLITPPWYQTWWAYCIYTALAGLLVLGIINYIPVSYTHLSKANAVVPRTLILINVGFMLSKFN